MFKVIYAAWVMTVESFFKEIPAERSQVAKVWESWWPKVTPETTILQEGFCFRSTCSRTILLN
jgi:hypothetical protein